MTTGTHQLNHARFDAYATAARSAGDADNGMAALVAKLCIAVFLFFSSIGATPPAIFGGDDTPGDGGKGALVKQLVYMLLFATSVLLAIRSRRERIAPWIPLGLAAMLAWIWMSLGWSAAPGFAIRRIVVVTIVIFSAFLLARVARPKGVFDFLAWFFLAIILIDVAASLTLPGAVSVKSETDIWASAGGTWRGMHLEKNAAGAFGALGALLFLYRAGDPDAHPLMRLAWAAMTPLAMLFVYKTGSKTSFALVPAVSLLGLFCTAIAGRPRIVGLGALLLIVGAGMTLILMPDLISHLQQRFTVMLQDPRSFTGRSQIWSVELAYAHDHFWRGSGYGSFWAVGEDGPLYQYGTGWLQTIPAGHNGYFDIRTQTGAIGICIAALAAIVIPMIVLLTRTGIGPRLRWLAAALLLFFAFHNLLETSLFDRDNAIWIMALFAMTALTYRSDDPRAQPGRPES